MDKKRALEIAIVNACCTFTKTTNNLCEMCPWYNTDECSSVMLEENIIIEAINVLKGEITYEDEN